MESRFNYDMLKTLGKMFFSGDNDDYRLAQTMIEQHADINSGEVIQIYEEMFAVRSAEINKPIYHYEVIHWADL